MKIPRYQAGRTNVGALESGKASLRTPGQAAWAEGAKYKAISDIADTGAETINTMIQFNRQMDAADDKVTNAINDGHWKQALEGAKAEAEERSLTDPTWSKTNYIKQVEQINKTRLDAIKQLKDPESKKQATRLIESASVMSIQEAELDGLDIQAKRIATSLQTSYDQALMDEDYEFASHLLDVGMDATNGTPIVGSIKGQAARAKLNKLIENKRVDEAAKELASGVEDAYLKNGQVGGDQAYEKLVRNTDIEDDVKKSALLQSTQHRQNFMRSQADDKARESAQVMRVKVFNSEDAKVGQFTEADNERALASGDYGEPDSPTAMAAWAEVYRNIKGFNKLEKSALDIDTAVKTGKILDPTSENREGLSRYVDKHVEATGVEVNSNEYFRFIADTAQTVGVLPQTERSGLNGGYVSKKQAAEYLPLWTYLRDNNLLKPDLGLTDKANTMYYALDSLMKYGTDPATALETIWEARDLPPVDKEALKLDFAKESSSFKELKNSDYFADADKWTTWGPEVETKMEMRYDKVREEVYMATKGNVDAANRAAEQATKTMFGPSNFGNKANDYTIQENPLGKDMSTFQETIISQINGLKVEGWEGKPAAEAGITFSIYTDNEYKQVKALDPEAVTFHETPQQEGEGRDGVRRYQVWHNGRPVVNMDTGMVVDFPIDSATARKITRISDIVTARGEQVQQTNDRIAELEKEIEENAEVRSPYVDGPALKAELEGLKRSLPKMIKRRDETQYSVYPMFPYLQIPEVIN